MKFNDFLQAVTADTNIEVMINISGISFSNIGKRIDFRHAKRDFLESEVKSISIDQDASELVIRVVLE